MLPPLPEFEADIYRREIDVLRAKAKQYKHDRPRRMHYIYWRRRALAALRQHGKTYRKEPIDCTS